MYPYLYASISYVYDTTFLSDANSPLSLAPCQSIRYVCVLYIGITRSLFDGRFSPSLPIYLSLSLYLYISPSFSPSLPLSLSPCPPLPISSLSLCLAVSVSRVRANACRQRRRRQRRHQEQEQEQEHARARTGAFGSVGKVRDEIVLEGTRSGELVAM